MAEGRKPRLVHWVAGACLLALVALFVSAQVRGWTPSKVERTVNRDLQRGATRNQIEAYLDAKGRAHSYSDDPVTVRYYNEAARPSSESPSGVVFAEVPDPNVGIGGEGTITVLFFLDREGRLVRSYVRVWILSL